MSDILAKICDDKREHIEQCKADSPLEEMIERAASAPKIRGFAARLEAFVTEGRTGLIGEIKKGNIKSQL